MKVRTIFPISGSDMPIGSGRVRDGDQDLIRTMKTCHLEVECNRIQGQCNTISYAPQGFQGSNHGTTTKIKVHDASFNDALKTMSLFNYN